MKKYLTRKVVDWILNVDRSKRCATQKEIKILQKAIIERATKKGILAEDLDQNDMDKILNKLGIHDVEICSKERKTYLYILSYCSRCNGNLRTSHFNHLDDENGRTCNKKGEIVWA